MEKIKCLAYKGKWKDSVSNSKKNHFQTLNPGKKCIMFKQIYVQKIEKSGWININNINEK